MNCHPTPVLLSIILLGLASLQLTAAYPDHWLINEIDAGQCAWHAPRKPEHVNDFAGHHEDIVDDPLGTSVTARIDGELAESLCPGKTHTIEVNCLAARDSLPPPPPGPAHPAIYSNPFRCLQFFFSRGGRPELRRAVVGVSQGAWGASSGWVDVLPFCPQRADLGIENRPKLDSQVPVRWTHPLTLSCDASGEWLQVNAGQPSCTCAAA